MTTFLFVRHGKPETSEVNTKIYQGMGVHMLPLAEDGILQAQEISKDIRMKDADLIVSSPFGRALQTASILSKELQMDIRVETNLHEWCADRDYVYISDTEAAASFKEMIENKGINPLDKKYNWESLDDMRKRVFGVLDKYVHLSRVIVVCHGCLMQYVLEMNHHPEYCEIVEYHYGLPK